MIALSEELRACGPRVRRFYTLEYVQLIPLIVAQSR